MTIRDQNKRLDRLKLPPQKEVGTREQPNSYYYNFLSPDEKKKLREMVEAYDEAGFKKLDDYAPRDRNWIKEVMLDGWRTSMTGRSGRSRDGTRFDVPAREDYRSK